MCSELGVRLPSGLHTPSRKRLVVPLLPLEPDRKGLLGRGRSVWWVQFESLSISHTPHEVLADLVPGINPEGEMLQIIPR